MHDRIREIEDEEILATVQLTSCHLESNEPLQQGRQFDFDCEVITNKKIVRTKCLTDTGASAIGFVNALFVKTHKLDVIPLKRPCRLQLADDKIVPNITHMARVKFRLGIGHLDEIWCMITTLGKFDLILGMPWLELHDPDPKFSDRSLTFKSDYCITHCLTQCKPVTIYSGKPMPKRLTTSQYDIAEISAYAFMKMSELRHNEVIAMWPQHFEMLEDCSNEACASLTADVSAITAEDYEKFFDKIEKTPLTKKALKTMVPSEYHEWLDVWNPVQANKLPPRRSVDHRIDLKEGALPPAKKAYGMSREQASVVKKYIDDMLGKGYIRPSTSPYAAPVLIVKKPDGGLRVCVDYRALNALSIKNRNAPPLIRETLSRLCRAKRYTKFDIIAAFNEIRIKEGHEEKTAFLTRYGLYEYVVMPFGLCNAPGTFQAFINEVLREYLDVFCTAYLDDILIYSDTIEDHTSHVNAVLQKLHENKMYLDIYKCDFHVKEIKYLGLIITTEGLRMDQTKVDTIQQWKAPRCTKDVQAFLGFANFYRRFIFAYSKIAAPLTELTKSSQQKDFIYPWALDGPEQEAFEKLKLAFTTAPILTHFDPDKETWIESDASDYVIAAVLSQKDSEGVLRPIAYLSKKMSPQECNYEIYDKELLAIVKAFEEWHPELAGTPIEDPIRVITDHKNLEYFMSSKKLNRRQARWAEFLSEFNFQISYRPGKQGTKPDSLTRRPGDLPQEDTDARNKYQYQTIIRNNQIDPRLKIDLACMLTDDSIQDLTELTAMIYSLSEEGVNGSDLLESLEDGTPGDPGGGLISHDELMLHIRKAYATDEVAQRIIHAKNTGERKVPIDVVKKHSLKLELGRCMVQDELLFVHKRLYIPYDEELRTNILRLIHESPVGGHAGRSSTYERLSREYYWPRMTDSVSRFVKSCYVCKRAKSYREGKQGLLKPLPIPDTYWTDISVDFITPLPKCLRYGRIFEHIMVVVDRLSKKKKFVALDSLEVQAVVQAFIDWIWREEGYPKSIVSDRGSQFVSHFWQRLCQRIGTSPKLSTSFHPETDGQTESANSALKQYLRAYVNYSQDNWVDFLPIAEFEANSDKNTSTGLAPFLTTKGYLPRSGLEAPATLVEGTQSKRTEMRSADKLVQRIDELKRMLKAELKWSQDIQAGQADRNRQPSPAYRVGDMVMLDARNIHTKRPSKSLDHKNLGPFRIIRVIDNAAYELELPKSMQGIFPVFHPWLLHLDNSDPLPGQIVEPPPPVNVDDEGSDYEALEVVDSRIDNRRRDPLTAKKGCLMYKIRYTGYDSDNASPPWQIWTEAAGCPDLVADFHHTHPEKPGPHESFKTPEDWSPMLAVLLTC